MEVLKPLITREELSTMFKKSRLSETDIFKIASITHYTLVGQLSDLKREELSEVYMLEAKNIYRVLNTVSMLLGFFPSANQVLQGVVSTDFVQRFLQECEDRNDSNLSSQALKFIMLSRFLLSDCDPQAKFEPKFVGKMPTKLFSFRQMAADDWYKSYVTMAITHTAIILDKAGEDEAFRYICLNLVWYMNKSQTFRYHRKSTDKDDNEMFYRILIEFLNYVDGDTAIITNKPTAPLYKDL